MLAIVITLIVAALAGILAPLTRGPPRARPGGVLICVLDLRTDFTGFFAFLGLAALILL